MGAANNDGHSVVLMHLTGVEESSMQYIRLQLVGELKSHSLLLMVIWLYSQGCLSFKLE